MAEFSIEEVFESDTNALLSVLKIFNEIIEGDDSFLEFEPVELSYLMDKFKSKERFRCFLCYVTDGGKVSPCGFYYIHTLYKGKVNQANGTYGVSKEHRGRKIGRKLGLHSIETARSDSYRGILFTNVVASNNAAVKLWESIGFRHVGTVPGAYELHSGEFANSLLYLYDLTR